MATKISTGKDEAKVKTPAKKIQFDFSSSEAETVHLAGDFNNWDSQAIPLKKDKKGMWKTSINLKPGRYEYRFLVDGNWENGASCSGCVPNGFGGKNCVRIVE
jgi:1,4-alpha-glucan branching enzyme